ncbi:MAG: hypothetical protein JWR37_2129 [Mycobacterium sp.]|nr:hypothetical protein [Mycobacterium sp.]
MPVVREAGPAATVDVPDQAAGGAGRRMEAEAADVQPIRAAAGHRDGPVVGGAQDALQGTVTLVSVGDLGGFVG